MGFHVPVSESETNLFIHLLHGMPLYILGTPTARDHANVDRSCRGMMLLWQQDVAGPCHAWGHCLQKQSYIIIKTFVAEKRQAVVNVLVLPLAPCPCKLGVSQASAFLGCSEFSLLCILPLG